MTTSIQSQFPLSDAIIYLNHAAVAPWPARTSEAVKRFADENSRTGAQKYTNWLRKEAELRNQIKALINAPQIEDIALVKNTSEALSFVAQGLTWRAGQNIVSSNEEFPSNRIPWQALVDQGVDYRQADLNRNPSPEQAIFDLVDAETRLITISSIQFASGIRLDIEKIGKFCRDRNILFCVDAIQSIGAVQFDVQRIGADFVMADGHKWMLGPEGLGLFYTTPEARKHLAITQFGWHMIEDPGNYDNRPWTIAGDSRRFECGSMNMLGIHALSASLGLLLEFGMEVVEEKVVGNAGYLKDLINEHPRLNLITPSDSETASGIVIFEHRSVDNSQVFEHLRSQGVVCALRGGGIRFSPHFYNQKAELEKAVLIAAEVQ